VDFYTDPRRRDRHDDPCQKEDQIMGNDSKEFKRLSKSRLNHASSQTAEVTPFDDSTPSIVSPITKHQNHPVHDDRKLVRAIFSGDRSALRKLVDRAAPFIENFATDAVWSSYSEGYQYALTLLMADNYFCLQRWDGDRCPLNRFLDHFFRSALSRVIKKRRQAVADNQNLYKAIRESVDALSDIYYWILCKIVIEKVPRKKILKFADQLPELRIKSQSSIGTTYCRALRRLAKVCPPQYVDTVNEFINTRKRSGKLH